MNGIENQELAVLVEKIRGLLKKENLQELDNDYKRNMEKAVRDGYSPVFIKKYFEDFLFRKITTHNK